MEPRYLSRPCVIILVAVVITALFYWIIGCSNVPFRCWNSDLQVWEGDFIKWTGASLLMSKTKCTDFNGISVTSMLRSVCVSVRTEKLHRQSSCHIETNVWNDITVCDCVKLYVHMLTFDHVQHQVSGGEMSRNILQILHKATKLIYHIFCWKALIRTWSSSEVSQPYFLWILLHRCRKIPTFCCSHP